MEALLALLCLVGLYYFGRVTLKILFGVFKAGCLVFLGLMGLCCLVVAMKACGL